jgi:Cu/Zn superoxide dismutase
VRRITRAALGGIAGCALAVGATGVASGELLDLLKVHRDSNDVNTSYVTLDAAKAKIIIDKGTDREGRPNTTFTIRVTGIDVSGVDFLQPVKPLGSHLHTGQCVDGDYGDLSASPSPIQPGSQAGPHYNHDVALGKTPIRITTETEVWFNLVPDQEGMAYDRTTVPFVPIDSAKDGEMSIVVHVDSTNATTGGAGQRQVCFPLSVSGIFPTE